jgi:hypothetical protein
MLQGETNSLECISNHVWLISRIVQDTTDALKTDQRLRNYAQMEQEMRIVEAEIKAAIRAVITDTLDRTGVLQTMEDCVCGKLK